MPITSAPDLDRPDAQALRELAAGLMNQVAQRDAALAQLRSVIGSKDRELHYQQTRIDQLTHEMAFNVGLLTDTTPALEDLEYGPLFNFEALQLPEISKFYDGERYDDALWIPMDKRKSSMTLEELCDFPELDGKVATQVVHLELFTEEGQYFISHIDHKYILHILDEYAERGAGFARQGSQKA